MNIGEQFCTLNDIVIFATKAARKIVEIYQPGRVACGYLTIRSAEDGRILLLVPIGEIPENKAAIYFRNSVEKGERLFAHPEHVSSWQSRDPLLQQYGGAIRCKYINSFSGMPEYADETLCVSIGAKFGWLNERSSLDTIFGASDNELGVSALVIT